MVYTIEINIDDIPKYVCVQMAIIGKDAGWDVIMYGHDQLVFASKTFDGLTELTKQLAKVCDANGINISEHLV